MEELFAFRRLPVAMATSNEGHRWQAWGSLRFRTLRPSVFGMLVRFSLLEEVRSSPRLFEPAGASARQHP